LGKLGRHGHHPSMSQSASSSIPPRGLGVTQRRDLWWLGPAATAVGLLSFVIYSTWAALQGTNYHVGPYLSPFYSPELFGDSGHAWFGPKPGWWPSLVPFSPALLVLWAPGGFRLTCYYYRKAYYRSIWLDPVACAVGEARKSYLGENSLPLILQNVHRYFMYLALIFLVLLASDGVHSYFWDTHADGTPVAGGGTVFGIGLGSLILTLNPIFLGFYTFGCHSLRHLIGGKKDCFSCSASSHLRYQAWSVASVFNRNHQLWAWISLFMVGFADIYVRCVAAHVWTDIRFF
jgi:hypothetical protein